eukprot:GHVT01100968.1.p1 GENE.GHVT01100968.1~~GHVT01100968.1.p1  ORF type:complete len:586 (+),score=150.43 GHVT01100968.1:214-1758(+)
MGSSTDSSGAASPTDDSHPFDDGCPGMLTGSASPLAFLTPLSSLAPSTPRQDPGDAAADGDDRSPRIPTRRWSGAMRCEAARHDQPARPTSQPPRKQPSKNLAEVVAIRLGLAPNEEPTARCHPSDSHPGADGTALADARKPQLGAAPLGKPQDANGGDAHTANVMKAKLVHILNGLLQNKLCELRVNSGLPPKPKRPTNRRQATHQNQTLADQTHTLTPHFSQPDMADVKAVINQAAALLFNAARLVEQFVTLLKHTKPGLQVHYAIYKPPALTGGDGPLGGGAAAGSPAEGGHCAAVPPGTPMLRLRLLAVPRDATKPTLNVFILVDLKDAIHCSSLILGTRKTWASSITSFDRKYPDCVALTATLRSNFNAAAAAARRVVGRPPPSPAPTEQLPPVSEADGDRLLPRNFHPSDPAAMLAFISKVLDQGGYHCGRDIGGEDDADVGQDIHGWATKLARSVCLLKSLKRIRDTSREEARGARMRRTDPSGRPGNQLTKAFQNQRKRSDTQNIN